MHKRLVCSTGLLVMLILLFAGLALAQRPVPTVTSRQQGLESPSGGNKIVPRGYVPVYCNPCLFYGGDGDPNNVNANGLWDNNSADFGIDGQVYSPFLVPKKTGKCAGVCDWNVSELFVALELAPYIPGVGPQVPPTDAVWTISQNVVSGGAPSTATVVCSGTDPSPTFTDTGRHFFGYLEEFVMTVTVTGCTLKTGAKTGTEYWQQVTPEFAATSNFELSYESNVPDSPPPNAYGLPEPYDNSFFYAPALGAPTLTPATQTGCMPCHIFSAGVEGTLSKK